MCSSDLTRPHTRRYAHTPGHRRPTPRHLFPRSYTHVSAIRKNGINMLNMDNWGLFFWATDTASSCENVLRCFPGKFLMALREREKPHDFARLPSGEFGVGVPASLHCALNGVLQCIHNTHEAAPHEATYTPLRPHARAQQANPTTFVRAKLHTCICHS